MTSSKIHTMAQDKDIWILVVAHPDDESMFFIPTLRNLLTNAGGKPTIHVLCLSNGDYRDASDGPIRTQEIHHACSCIGIQNERIPKKETRSDKDFMAAVTVLNDDRMKDGPNEVWNSDLIAETVLEHILKVVPLTFRENQKNKETSAWNVLGKEEMQVASLDKECCMQSININLLTFDEGGVSNHPNHKDVFWGVRCFINDKCHTTSNESILSASLQLYEQQNENKLTNKTIKVNVGAFTLKTISNPLMKYFFWIFVDLLPFLLGLLMQVLGYLIFFLSGALLNLRRHSMVSQMRQFSGVNITSEGLQCRLMDPALVWRAMAAHRSQFVWYRRLSIIFSRYTYINELNQISLDKLPCEDEHHEYTTKLPPISIIKEVESSPKFLLTHEQINAMRESVIPTSLHHRPWKRIYSLSRDGDSFVSFEKLVGDWNDKQGNQSTLLVVKTMAGAIIGGYSDIPFVIKLSKPIGSAERCRLFLMENDSIIVYGKQPSLYSKKIILDSTRRIVAFGGGSTEKCDEGFGLCLEDGFARGTTSRCEAFGNEPLVPDKGGIFDILDVEVWGFVFGQL